MTDKYTCFLPSCWRKHTHTMGTAKTKEGTRKAVGENPSGATEQPQTSFVQIDTQKTHTHTHTRTRTHAHARAHTQIHTHTLAVRNVRIYITQSSFAVYYSPGLIRGW